MTWCWNFPRGHDTALDSSSSVFLLFDFLFLYLPWYQFLLPLPLSGYSPPGNGRRVRRGGGHHLLFDSAVASLQLPFISLFPFLFHLLFRFSFLFGLVCFFFFFVFIFVGWTITMAVGWWGHGRRSSRTVEIADFAYASRFFYATLVLQIRPNSNRWSSWDVAVSHCSRHQLKLERDPKLSLALAWFELNWLIDR